MSAERAGIGRLSSVFSAQSVWCSVEQYELGACSEQRSAALAAVGGGTARRRQTDRLLPGVPFCIRVSFRKYRRMRWWSIIHLAGNRSVWSRGKKMCQKAAWSEDGIHFQTLGEILPNQIFENRDPKVYRFGQKHWFMVLFLDGHEFGIFVSDNMKDWRQTQSLVIPEAWECPDLVRLRVKVPEMKNGCFGHRTDFTWWENLTACSSPRHSREEDSTEVRRSMRHRRSPIWMDVYFRSRFCADIHSRITIIAA